MRAGSQPAGGQPWGTVTAGPSELSPPCQRTQWPCCSTQPIRPGHIAPPPWRHPPLPQPVPAQIALESVRPLLCAVCPARLLLTVSKHLLAIPSPSPRLLLAFPARWRGSPHLCLHTPSQLAVVQGPCLRWAIFPHVPIPGRRSLKRSKSLRQAMGVVMMGRR